MSETNSSQSSLTGKIASIAGEFKSESADETFSLGARIGRVLKGGEVILLKGELGAGKTVFAKGIAQGLAIAPEDVTSPSFTLVNIYQGRQELYHIDLYRLEHTELSNLGLDEIFAEPESVIVIEWAERLSESPDNAIEVRFEYISDSVRKITINERRVIR